MSKRPDYDITEGQTPPARASWDLTNPTSELARAYDRFLDRCAVGAVESLVWEEHPRHSRAIIGEINDDGAGYDRSFGYFDLAEVSAHEHREKQKPQRCYTTDFKAPARVRLKRNALYEDYRNRVIHFLRETGHAVYSTEITAALGQPPGTISFILSYMESRGLLRRTGNYRPRSRGGNELEWILRETFEAHKDTDMKVSPPPLCSCGRPCMYYGPVGGYSVRCGFCNEQNAGRQRTARSARVTQLHLPLPANHQPAIPMSNNSDGIKRHRSTYDEFAKLLVWVMENKPSLQQRFDGGENVTAVAMERRTSPSTMRKALDSAGVELYRNRLEKSRPGTNGTSVPLKNILTVVARIARDLNVDYAEIKPYLDRA